MPLSKEEKQIAELFSTFRNFSSLMRIEDKDTAELFYFSHDTWHGPQRHFEEDRTDHDIILKPRRVGFSTLEFCRDIYFAITHPNTTTVIVAQEQSFSKDNARTVRQLYTRLLELADEYGLPIPQIKGKPTVDYIELDNDARILFRFAPREKQAAQDSGRGITIHRLHATEIAFWKFPFETMASFLKAAQKAQSIVIESTPWGAEGYFYDRYMNARANRDPLFTAHFYPWFLQEEYQREPRKGFDATPLERYREPDLHRAAKKYGMELTAQQVAWWRYEVDTGGLDETIREYPFDDETCFIGSAATWLESEDLEWVKKCYTDPILTKDVHTMTVQVYRQPVRGRRYIVGLDASNGYGPKGDASAACVIDAFDGGICATGKSHNINGKHLAHVGIALAQEYNNALIVPEAKGPGLGTRDELVDLRWKNLYFDPKLKRFGLDTNTSTRAMLMSLVRETVQDKSISIVCRDLGQEYHGIVINEKSLRPEHGKGKHDDLLFAFGLALIGRQLYGTASNENMSVQETAIGEIDDGSIGDLDVLGSMDGFDSI